MKRIASLLALLSIIALFQFSCASTSASKGPFSKPGFATIIEDGRLWVFKDGSKELEAARTGHELAKHVTRLGVGPAGMTVKAPDTETILAYISVKPDFATIIEDGRLWVFRDGSKELEAARTTGHKPEKHVTRIGAGPAGMTVKAPDMETILAYISVKPGFATIIKDGRLWVFRDGSKELEAARTTGRKPEKHVTRIGAGPAGMTVKAPDMETILAYISVKPGFATIIKDGRLWVFRDGSKGLEEARTGHEPEKHVTRIGAGPAGMTIKAPDVETLQAYLWAK